MFEITREEAIKLAESEFWKDMTPREIAMFQMHNELLCMPFNVIHKAMEDALGRPVFTHEFAFADMLRKELLGEAPAPTLAEIINLIPEEKRVIVTTT